MLCFHSNAFERVLEKLSLANALGGNGNISRRLGTAKLQVTVNGHNIKVIRDGEMSWCKIWENAVSSQELSLF